LGNKTSDFTAEVKKEYENMNILKTIRLWPIKVIVKKALITLQVGA